MSKLKTLILPGLLSLALSAAAQTNNPKKDYFGDGLTARFSVVVQTELKNFEFAEVLNSSELLGKKSTGDFDCKVFFCYNGPSDPELEYCNNATNYYISNGRYELPTEFRLFKVGPFYQVDKATVTDGPDENSCILTVDHRYDTEKFTARYLITFDKVKLISK